MQRDPRVNDIVNFPGDINNIGSIVKAKKKNTPPATEKIAKYVQFLPVFRVPSTFYLKL